MAKGRVETPFTVKAPTDCDPTEHEVLAEAARKLGAAPHEKTKALHTFAGGQGLQNPPNRERSAPRYRSTDSPRRSALTAFTALSAAVREA